MRNHQPIELENLKGLWSQGDPDNTPLDHFEDCNNIVPLGKDWTVRDGIGIHQNVAVPLENVKRAYNYPTQTANTLLVLTYTGTTGKIYHVVNSTTIYEILSITGMTDFAFIPYNGRAYISPFGTFTTGDLNIQKGLQSQFLYVYLGAGITARKAAGNPPTGTLVVANGTGNTDPGFKVFGVVFESDTGWLSPPAAFDTHTTVATNGVSFGSVPVAAAGQGVVKRHLVSTISITNYNGNLTGYPFFFIPNATINDNTATFLNNITFFDIDLVDDASHLLDNYAELPAGAALSLYHNRLVLSTTYSDISILLVSAEGEPEAISQIDGLIIVPLDGNPITNHQELRDVMYVTKRSRTLGYIDNGEEPSEWPMTIIDNALGTSVHGIATVLDSGASSVDFLIVATYAGVMLFNGRYIAPELSWKINKYWQDLDRNLYRLIQIINVPINKRIYIVLPTGDLLIADYSEGLDPKNVKWCPTSYEVTVNCIAVVNIDEVIIGADV